MTSATDNNPVDGTIGRQSNRRWLGWLALILVLAMGLRLFRLSDRVVWFDESLSLLVARANVTEVITQASDDIHPPLYPLALHYWIRLAPGEWWARMSSVVLGSLTVLVVFGIGCQLGGRNAGLLSALVLAACPLHVWYSQELRMYALQVLLVCLTMWCLIRAMAGGRNSWAVSAGGLAALSLYVQLTSALTLLAAGVYVLTIRRRDRPALRVWLIAQGVTMVLFAPWIVIALRQFHAATGGLWLRPFTWKQAVNFLALFSGNYLNDPCSRWLSIIATALLLAGGLAVLLSHKERRTPAGLPILWFAIPVLALGAVSLRQNLFLPRALLIVAPAFAVIMGWSTAVLYERGQRVVSVAVVIGLLLFNAHALAGYFGTANRWIKSPLRAAAHQIAAEFRPGDIIIHSSRFSYRPMQYYLNARVTQALLVDADAVSPHLIDVIGRGTMPSDTAAMQRIWLVLFPDFQQPGAHLRLLAWMDQHHSRQQVLINEPDLFIALYNRHTAALVPQDQKSNE